MGPERSEIETFLALAQELHFGRTADRLLVSRAHVTQTIQKLERRIGVPLFERSTRQVRLTPLGVQLRDGLAPAYAQIQSTFATVVAAARGITGTLTVGFLTAATGRIAHAAAERFAERHPDCEIHVREVQIGTALEPLRDGELDVMLICFPIADDEFVQGPVLLDEPTVLAVPAGHPFARRGSVSIEDLARERVIQVPASIPDYLRAARHLSTTPSGTDVPVGPTADTFQEVLSLVGAGKGVFPCGATGVQYYARPDVAYVPIHDGPYLRWGPIWRRSAATSRVEAFVRAALDLERAGSTPGIG
ncbi:LysR family transcriptional regulator [Microbacterium bovistercoris]|uniref:LysR family transcriptional regulator n=1 Tax=Microbacterium bovistercoris TaxID=2293570 RepID=A0A371NPU8_9MICO|nr:LysR family transcriptional regulator [Microbacterium bovistercoris]REJ04178.1 LysR family transcriptional regulator [Microbacterium bovistercoris]